MASLRPRIAEAKPTTIMMLVSHWNVPTLWNTIELAYSYTSIACSLQPQPIPKPRMLTIIAAVVRFYTEL